MGRNNKWDKRDEQIENNGMFDAYDCAAAFYGAQALQVLVQSSKDYEPFRHSHEKLMEDITAYKEKVVEYLTPRIYDYMVMACYGELRHADRTNIFIKNYDYKGRVKPKCPGSSSNTWHYGTNFERDDAYLAVLDYTPESVLSAAEHHFLNAEWPGCYGGYKWGNIARHGLRYGKISNEIFCDVAFSLSHNTSPFLNKSATGIFQIYDTSYYLVLLDTKFSSSPDSVINTILRGRRRNLPKLPELYKLIFRTMQLFEKEFDMRIFNELIKDIRKSQIETQMMNYKPLQFGKKVFKPGFTLLCCANKEENDFLSNLEIGMPVCIPDAATFDNFAYWANSINCYEKVTYKHNTFENFSISDINRKSGTIYIKSLAHSENSYVGKVNFREIIVLDQETFKTKKMKGTKVV